MASRIRFHLDENIDTAVAMGLRRRGIDVTRTQEVGLRMASDEAHFDFARREHRVLVTQDPDFVQAHHKGVAHEGIVYCDQGIRSIGEMIEALTLIFGALTPEEMRGRLEYM